MHEKLRLLIKIKLVLIGVFIIAKVRIEKTLYKA